MTKRTTTRIVLTLLAAAVAAIAAIAATGGRAAGPGLDVAELEDANFVVVCKFSHRAPDDPIVHPGAPGMSHDHTFFEIGRAACRERGESWAVGEPCEHTSGSMVMI